MDPQDQSAAQQPSNQPTNSKSKLIIFGVVAVVIIAGGIFFMTKKPADKTTSNNSTNESSSSVNKSFTKSEVAAHNSKDDCWTIINGNVYDLTKFIPGHPGGQEILKACGKDGTVLFTTRTTSDGQKVGSGTSHSSNASSQLDSLKIGTVGQ